MSTMQFIITIDTEGDNQWDHGRELTVENIRFVPRFQTLCEEYGIQPTYLVTSEVCLDGYARDLFGEYVSNNRAEVGAHLHSWSTPPFMDLQGLMENDSNHAFASELPYELLSKKITNLTEQITFMTGKRPTSFRSGRYGFNEDVARSLVEHGYIVDSSVTPYVSWAEHKGIPGGIGGPDFINSTFFPHRFEFRGGYINEIPITIVPTSFPLRSSEYIARLYFRHVGSSVLLRGLRRLFYSNQPVWLRPVPGVDLATLMHLINVTINRKVPFLTMMFHSSELMPGCSKYRPDNISVEELYKLLENLFKQLNSMKITSATLTGAARSIMT